MTFEDAWMSRVIYKNYLFIYQCKHYKVCIVILFRSTLGKILSKYNSANIQCYPCKNTILEKYMLYIVRTGSILRIILIYLNYITILVEILVDNSTLYKRKHAKLTIIKSIIINYISHSQDINSFKLY